MSFICAISGKPVSGKPRRVIVKKRDKVYAEQWGWVTPKEEFRGAEKPKKEWRVIAREGKGWEIEKEIMIDPNTPDAVLEKFLKRKR